MCAKYPVVAHCCCCLHRNFDGNVGVKGVFSTDFSISIVVYGRIWIKKGRNNIESISSEKKTVEIRTVRLMRYKLLFIPYVLTPIWDWVNKKSYPTKNPFGILNLSMKNYVLCRCCYFFVVLIHRKLNIWVHCWWEYAYRLNWFAWMHLQQQRTDATPFCYDSHKKISVILLFLLFYCAVFIVKMYVFIFILKPFNRIQ